MSIIEKIYLDSWQRFNTRIRQYYVDRKNIRSKFCLRLHYSGTNSYAFVNGVEILKLKAKDSETNTAPLNIQKI